MSFVARRRDKPVYILSAMTKRGGVSAIDSYGSDVEVSETSLTYVLKREFNLSTPTPPSGVSVFRYALLVSAEIKSGQIDGERGWCRIDIDDITLAEIECQASYTWFDRAKEVSSGLHNVKIYLKSALTLSGNTAYLRGTRGKCGIGTNSTTNVKIASFSLGGDARLLHKFQVIQWGA